MLCNRNTKLQIPNFCQKKARHLATEILQNISTKDQNKNAHGDAWCSSKYDKSYKDDYKTRTTKIKHFINVTGLNNTNHCIIFEFRSHFLQKVSHQEWLHFCLISSRTVSFLDL